MKIRSILFGLILLGLSSSVIAMPITGSTLFFGVYKHNGTSLFNATQFSLGPVLTIGSKTLAPLTGFRVIFNPFNLNVGTSQVLWQQTIGNILYQYTLSGPLYSTSTSNSRTIAGTGLLSITGYHSTSYNFAFTTQIGSIGKYSSFSASSQIPEPMPLALIGIGLIGIGLFSRKRNEVQTYT